MNSIQIEPFFDPRTSTLTYVVWDPQTRDAVVIDPVLDYDPKASKTWTESVDAVVEFVRSHSLNVRALLETHAHADHLSGSQFLKSKFPGAKVGIGSGITQVQTAFKRLLDMPEDFSTDGSQFDLLLEPDDVYEAGSITVETIATPGHTPACVTYRVGDNVFTGDALFMPDSGTGRCDFPGGSAEDLFHSVHDVLYALPDDTKVWVGHDYQPNGRALAFQTTIFEEKAANVALPASRSRHDFTRWRKQRDASLEAPRLLFQSVQVNVDAGRLPEPGQNEVAYLKIPLNVFRPAPREDAEVTLERV